MNLLKTPLEIGCPYCKAEIGKECLSFTYEGKDYYGAPHVRREEAMANENKRRIQEHIYERPDAEKR